MNIDKILEYQTIDMEVYRVEREFAKSPEVQKAVALQNKKKAITASLLKLDKEAETLFADLEKAEAQIKEAVAAQDKAHFSMGSIADLNAADNVEKALNGYLEAFGNLEKEIKRIFKRLSDIKNEARKLLEQGNAANNEYKASLADYERKSQEIKQSMQGQIAKLSELRKEIDESIFRRYKLCRDNKKMPAFVPYDAPNCTACGMNISPEVGDKLKNSGDVAECPSCRRIVYLK